MTFTTARINIIVAFVTLLLLGSVVYYKYDEDADLLTPIGGSDGEVLTKEDYDSNFSKYDEDADLLTPIGGGGEVLKKEDYDSNFSWAILSYLEAKEVKLLGKSALTYEEKIESATETADWIIDEALPAQVKNEIIQIFSDPSPLVRQQPDGPRPLITLASGGSPTCGAFVTLAGTYQHHFATLLDRYQNLSAGETVIIQRGHGHRNTFHTTQLMHAFYPNQPIDIVFWEFSLNDDSATKGNMAAGVNFLTLYINQLRRYYMVELNLDPPKVVFIGLTMKRLGMTANHHLDAVEKVCSQHADVCLGMIHIPSFFKSLKWNMTLLLDHFVAPDGVHPNALTHSLIGRLAFDMVTKVNNHTFSQNDGAVPRGKRDKDVRSSSGDFLLPSTPLSAQIERLLFHHHPVASFVSESPRNDINYLDYGSTKTNFTSVASPSTMIQPSNLGDLEIVLFGKSLATRVDRKFEIELNPCNDPTGQNPIFNLTHLTLPQRNSSGNSKRIAFAGLEIAGQEKRAKEGLGDDKIQITIGLPTKDSFNVTPSQMFRLPKNSEFQYAWMDLASIYVIFDTPIEIDYVTICRQPALPANQRVTFVQLVLYA